MEDFCEIEASFNPHRKVIGIDGDGQAEIKFTSDATQLAKVLTIFAKFVKCRVKLRIERLAEHKTDVDFEVNAGG